MREFPFHVRAIDEDGNTIRQLTVAFPDEASAQAAADRAERTTGDKHFVCVSLDAKDPRNTVVNGLQVGYAIHKPGETVPDVPTATATAAPRRSRKS